MDGTLLTLIAVAERIWGRWARRHHLDVASFLPTIHGVQTVDTIRRLALPGVDPEIEAAAITRAELDDVDGIEAIAGAADFLCSLPDNRWSIVTSATRDLALRRLAAAGLPLPAVIVTAETSNGASPLPTVSCSRRSASDSPSRTVSCSRTHPPASPPPKRRARHSSSSPRRTRS